jgi:hypothetical protein
VGSASRGMVRRWGRFFSRVRPRGVPDRERVPERCNASGQPWTSAVTLPPGRNGLIAWRIAVLSMFREPSLGRHVHRAFLRSVVLDSTPIIAATACHQRNYVERYSRSIARVSQGHTVHAFLCSLLFRQALVPSSFRLQVSR